MKGGGWAVSVGVAGVSRRADAGSRGMVICGLCRASGGVGGEVLASAVTKVETTST